jgi:hypothetical protein
MPLIGVLNDALECVAGNGQQDEVIPSATNSFHEIQYMDRESTYPQQSLAI